MKRSTLAVSVFSLAMGVSFSPSSLAATAASSDNQLVAKATSLDPTQRFVKLGSIDPVANHGIVVNKGADRVSIEAANPRSSKTVEDSSGVSLYTTLQKSGDVAKFTVTGNSVQLEKTADGGVDVYANRGQGVRVLETHINAPFAVDSSGARVATTYSVANNTITQSVSGDAKFPVAADPKVSVGLSGVYMSAWGWQWVGAAKGLATAGGIGAVASCVYAGKIPVVGSAVQKVCTLAGVGSIAGLWSFLKQVWKDPGTVSPNKCYQIRAPWEKGDPKEVSSSKC